MHELTATAEVDPAEAFRLEGPHLRLNMVTSLDGAAVIDGRVGPLTGPADQELLHGLRALADVVVVGAGTVRAEGYGPVLLPDARWRAGRRARGQSDLPPLAVVSRSLDLDPDGPLFAEPGPRVILITCAACPGPTRERYARVADVIVAGEETVDLAEAVAALGQRGLTRVLSEGGPELFSDLFEADLVDELCLAVSPMLVGLADQRISDDAPFAAPLTLRLAAAYRGEDFLFLRYRRAGS